MANETDFQIENGVLKKYTGPGGDVVIPDGVTRIRESAFKWCRSLTSVVIPEGVTSIGGCAFGGCKSLTSVVLPDSVTCIEPWTFSDCYSLTSVAIPEGVTSIGKQAFDRCYSLASIVVPKNVNKIEKQAFAHCGELKKVEFDGAVPKCAADAFKGCKQLAWDPEFYFTTRKLDVAFIGKQLYEDTISFPIENSKAVAYVLLHQSGKDWAAVVAAAAKDHAEEIAEDVCALLESKKTIPSKVGTNAAKFIMEWRVSIQPEQIKKLYSLLQKKKCTAAVEALEADIGIAALLKPEDTVVGERSRHPVEQLVLENWTYNSHVAELNKYITEGIRYRESQEVCSPAAVIFVIAAYAIQAPQFRDDINHSLYDDNFNRGFCKIRMDSVADQVASELDREELLKLLENLFYDKHVEDCVVPLGRYADAPRTEKLIPQMKSWGEWSRYRATGRQNMILLGGALMLNDSRPVVLYMEKIGLLGSYAKLRGTDADTIRDTVLADFGLDDQGQKEYSLGNKNIVARLNPDLTLALYDTAAGKMVKSIPKRGADPEKYEAAKTDFSDLKKNIKKVVKARNDLLFEYFLNGKTWNATNWKKAYLPNPVLRQVAQLIVWNQGEKTFTLRGQDAITSEGQVYTFSEEPVGVAHPIMMTKEEQAAWQNYFTENHLKQPFEQVWEPRYSQEEIAPDRYSGIVLPLLQFSNKQKHGIDLWGVSAYSDEFDVNMVDCKLSLEPSDWRCDSYADMTFTLGEFAVEQFTRYANHIVYLLDKWTITERILKDDVTITPLLGSFTVAQISEFIRLASEKGCTNVTALLLNYQNEHFGAYDPLAEFTLGE